MRTDLQLTNSILNIVEAVGWLALVGTVPLGWRLFTSMPWENALGSTAIVVISALGFVALVRTGKAVVLLAEVGTEARIAPLVATAQPVPLASDQNLNTATAYRGYEIVPSRNGVTVNGQPFPDVNEAKLFIDRKLFSTSGKS